MKHVTTKADLPTGSHYAVLKFSTIYIPGDERSRTHPGHGYPESSREVAEYISFVNDAELANWVTQHEKDSFAILSVTVPKFKLEKKLKIE